jgi:hypothetical protein
MLVVRYYRVAPAGGFWVQNIDVPEVVGRQTDSGVDGCTLTDYFDASQNKGGCAFAATKLSDRN